MELSDRLAGIERSLISALEETPVVDCHEHLRPEKARLDASVDVFTLFSHYTHGDLNRAGMAEADYQALYDQRIPLDRRWYLFKPYWERIRWGSYSRAALLAARRFYGCDDISDDTYEAISEAIREANRPGLYDRVLGDACGIRAALCDANTTALGNPLLRPVMRPFFDMETWEKLAHPPFEPEASIRSLDDYVDAVRRFVLRVKGEGAVGLKMVSWPNAEPSRVEASAAFERLRAGTEASLPPANPLRDYVVDQIVGFAAEHDLVVAVHTGYWGDFRRLDPLHMIPLIQRHPRTRFDIFHAGYPWVREALMLGKGFDNVWLNFCWTHIISQRFATAALEEAIDLIPTNKLLAFGGDFGLPVEKVYGHLVMAREDVARALAGRVAARQMTEAQALAIARQWFWSNPRELYRLDV